MPVYTPKFFGRLGAGFVQENSKGSTNMKDSAQKEGALAETISPAGKYQDIDIINDYRWTLSLLTPDDIAEVPYIRLREFKCTEDSIQKQFSFYTNLIGNTANAIVGDASEFKGVLGPYENLWPQTNPTNFTYKFPYFNKTGLELGSSWESLDSIGDSIKKVTGGIDKATGGKVGQFVQGVTDLVETTSNLALNMQYPSVGVTDRPKFFMAHNDRTINISFVLYNTYTVEDYIDNRDLIYLLMSQNLFNKRDYTTGVPPVFYSVYIPGQYFCYAAYVSNYKVENLGNQRLLLVGDQRVIVPDAYQIDITLTEMVKPSKNQYEAMTTGEALKLVTVTTPQNPLTINTTRQSSPGSNFTA